MFATLFKRAEQTVDSAIGDLGNRIVITIPFLCALGFGATSLTLYLTRLYGPELGTLLVAGAFCLLGFAVAIVVRVRKYSQDNTANGTDEAAAAEESATAATQQSMFDDDTVMAVMSSAAPILIPAILRTGLKNWPILLAAAAGLYVASRSDQTGAQSAPTPPSS